MVFSSVSFIFVFLPVLLCCYYAAPRRARRARNLILLAFSLFFYAYSGVKFLLIMLASILLNYVCALLAGSERPKKQRRLGVVFAALGGIGMLAWFKYAMFFTENLNALGISLPVPEITLPIGISFFTFQGLSYVIDVFRGDAAPQKNPLNVALYISLFPQLVAGPIVRYSTVADEITERRETLSDFSDGAVRFVFGLAKKLLLANALGAVADEIFAMPAEELAVSLSWLGVLAYTGQIYFDFSGYSDMAIGLGRMFGFHFLENFNYPYISKSIREYWQRWHISLSSWFRDYVYIPLGGSRRGTAVWLRNMCVIWLLTGLWHGAAWTYAAWGVLQGILVAGEKLVWGKAWRRMPCALQHIFTIALIAISLVLFRSDSLSYAFGFLGAMFGANGSVYDPSTLYYLRQYLPELVCAVIASAPAGPALKRALERRGTAGAELVLTFAPPVIAAALFAVSYMQLVTGTFNPFIYFRF